MARIVVSTPATSSGRHCWRRELVDEIRLAVFPVVVGAGRRLLGATTTDEPVRLASSRTVGTGRKLVTYQVG